MVTALIMAGGKGTRMGTRTEKPLIELGGDPMIKRVIDALSASKEGFRNNYCNKSKHPKNSGICSKDGI